MNDSSAVELGSSAPSYIDQLLSKGQQLCEQHRIDNPDLYQIVDSKKEQALESQTPKLLDIENNELTNNVQNLKPLDLLCGPQLREKIRMNQEEIRQELLSFNAAVIPRTQAHNRKCASQTIEDETASRATLMASQIQAWRSMLPSLIKKFAKITDYRRTTHLKHKLTVLMVFGLFAFIFRLSSRREMNRELTSPIIFAHLKKLFPEIDSIPHADTLARILEDMNPKAIEAVHIGLIKDLIRKKKFKKLLIKNHLPISVDGTQKLYRDGQIQDNSWCERKVGKKEDNNKQRYVYVIEANITLKNGLNIPLLTEYLFKDANQMLKLDGKQDSETTAFERLAIRIKQYFPRLKCLFLMDAMYATQQVIGVLHRNNWEYIIRLPKNKLKTFSSKLNRKKLSKQCIPGLSDYRQRRQEFYWENNVTYGYEWQLSISLVGCLEKYKEVNKKTGDIETHYSEHLWISSLPAHIDNVHELFNLGARKKELIEDSINTEKNRGYSYKHAFSYNWNAMQGFHYLMRLGHAINALSEFTKKLKDYVKTLGSSATLKLIKETLFSLWLSMEWYASQRDKTPQLRLQLE